MDSSNNGIASQLILENYFVLYHTHGNYFLVILNSLNIMLF